MAVTTLEEGMTLSIPATIISVADRSNVMVQAGVRTVLLEADFLEKSAEVLTPAPPRKATVVDDRITRLETLISELMERVTAPAAPKGKEKT